MPTYKPNVAFDDVLDLKWVSRAHGDGYMLTWTSARDGQTYVTSMRFYMNALLRGALSNKGWRVTGTFKLCRSGLRLYLQIV